MTKRDPRPCDTPAVAPQRVGWRAPVARIVRVALAATAVACREGSDVGAAGAARGWRSSRAFARSVAAPAWDTLWTRGGTAQDDTLLLMPWALAADSARVYLLDAAAYRVVAFRVADGSLAWVAGRKGGGPGEFAGPTAIATLPDGSVAVADSRNSRVSILDTAGRVTRELSLSEAGDTRSMCALRDGSLLLSTSNDEWPVVLMSAWGRVVRRYQLPWPDLARVPPLARQARLAGTPNWSTCVLALELGRGFAVFDGERFAAPHDYVESFDLPRVDVRRTFSSRTQRVLERRIAAYDVAVDGREIAAAFEGRTDAARRIIDVYDTQSGAYLRTYLLPDAVANLARWGGRYYIVSEREGYPVLLAVEDRATDGLAPKPPKARGRGRAPHGTQREAPGRGDRSSDGRAPPRSTSRW